MIRGYSHRSATSGAFYVGPTLTFGRCTFSLKIFNIHPCVFAEVGVFCVLHFAAPQRGADGESFAGRLGSGRRTEGIISRFEDAGPGLGDAHEARLDDGMTKERDRERKVKGAYLWLAGCLTRVPDRNPPTERAPRPVAQ